VTLSPDAKAPPASARSSPHLQEVRRSLFSKLVPIHPEIALVAFYISEVCCPATLALAPWKLWQEIEIILPVVALLKLSQGKYSS
jgi:hypothetical protein